MLSATTLTSATNQFSEGLGQLAGLRHLVESEGACALPGCSVRYETFAPVMWRAVARGFIKHVDASFVDDGLQHGFTAGVQVERMSGHRWFRNYPSALENRDAVVSAVLKRVDTAKTLVLGVWTDGLARGLRATFGASAIFPMGAVPKNSLYAPGEYRPTSDHTRTGLNAASDLAFLRHTLDTYNEIAWFLRQDYFMRVSDVDAAFPLLPLRPCLWPFFLFRFFLDQSPTTYLLVHLFGDFGTAGMPGVFKKFLVDVVLGMARSEHVLTLPMLVWVDDCSLIGESRDAVDTEMVRFHDWAWRTCGVAFKAVKDKLAAQRQLSIGFWWDSRSFTRELEERKLLQYVEMLGAFASRQTLTLHELQVVAGRMQRAIMTFPPGAACLLVSVFQLMTGLRLPWHKRRTTRRARADFQLVSDFLTLNLGRGYYSYDGFRRAPEVRSDASKSALLVAGGFVSACGAYCWWRYGTAAKRKPIDYLEGDTVVETVRRMCARWRQCVVPFGVDNMAFQRSAAKGRSAVDRLNDLVRELFALMVEHHFILDFFWLSSEDNLLADDLSRDKEQAFLEHARTTGFWSPDVVAERLPGTGDRRTLPEKRGSVARPTEAKRYICNCRQCGENGIGRCKWMPAADSVKCERCKSTCVCDCVDDDVEDERACCTRRTAPGPSLLRSSLSVLMLLAASFPSACPMPVSRVMSSAPVGRASIFTGLPARLIPVVENVLDNRLSSSSWRSVMAGLKIWRHVAESEGWSPIIATDDPERGGKLATFVCHMVDNTDLVWGSIETYVWGVRTWVKAQHEMDPTLGIANWAEWMDAVKVLTWVPAEPRRRAPVEVVKLIVEAADRSRFRDVQFVFLMLLLLFTYSRSETPCPKSHTGKDAYSPDEHLNVQDVDVRPIDGRPALHVRFRRIKQDQRVERPEARGEGDWSIVGDLPDTIFSIIQWYVLLAGLHGRARDPTSAFFVDPADTSRPLIYGQALGDFKRRQREVGVPEDKLAGLHGLRVEGYNGTRDVLGADVAQAHGLWSSQVHNRYQRFDLGVIARIPAAIMGAFVGAEAEDTDDADVERPVGPPTRRLVRGSADSSAHVPRPEDGPPPGWTSRRRTHFEDGSGRALARPKVSYVSPNGSRVAGSLKKAWSIYRDGAASTQCTSEGGSHAEADDVPPADIRGHVPLAEAARRSARVYGPALPHTALAYTLQ